MGEVNWALGLPQGPGAGEAFTQAYQAGLQRKKEQRTDDALRALLANPDDPNAAQEVGRHDPRLGLHVQQRQQQSLQQKLEANRENIVKGAQIIRQVQPKDQASWDQARQLAAQMGLDVSQIPPQFDERYVQGVVAIADTFAPPKQAAMPDVARKVDYYRSIGREDLAAAVLENSANPQIAIRNDDGTITLVRPPIGGQQQPDDDEWETISDGGPTPPASGNF